MSEISTATMISSAQDQNAPLLRTEFALEAGHGPVATAELQASAQGIFEAYLGGAKVGDDVLSPGWSSYEWRLRYRSYDVTELLQNQTDQPVVLGFALGNGWFRGRLGWSGARKLYGDRLGAIAALVITYEDGHQQVVRTDESWTSGPSAVLADDFYDGQTIDARLASDAWLRPGFSDDSWGGVTALDFDADMLVEYVGPPVVRHEEIRPVEIWQSPAGKTLIDFGQNLVGWLKFSVRGERGQTITHPPRRGAGERRARRPPAAHREVHRRVDLERRGGLLRADLHLPRLPLCRGHRLARRAHRGLPGRRRRLLGAGADRSLRVLRPDAQSVAPQCGLGPARQLPRRADRLPAARRAAGLDR